MKLKSQNVRVRFAPSPTGFVHVGSLLAALYNWLEAKKNGGVFILRVEDTDQARLVEGSVENLLKVLRWAGLDPDEGVSFDKAGKVTEKGEFGPYTQSKRLDIYRQYAKELIDKDEAYYCFCTKDRLDTLRAEQEKNKQLTKYDGLCRHLTEDEVAEKLKNQESFVIRQKVPTGQEVVLHDLIRGEVKFPTDSLDDSVLMKSDGFPTYHLAVVVDDHLMQITHVIRAQEWLPSSPKHLLLYKSFGWTAPQFAHLSHLLNKDRSKLSKRQGDVAVEDYIKSGYLPEAMLNFLAITGWNPGEGTEQEIYSLKELAKKFSLDRVHKTGAVFDREKLDWINGLYIRNLDIKELTKLCLPYLGESVIGNQKSEYVEKVIALERERMKKLSDISESTGFFFSEPEYPAAMLVWKKSDQEKTKATLIKLAGFLGGVKKW
ncbi:MAG: glutamate--tRNA ligase, partial [Patescibacteria group bacterium]